MSFEFITQSIMKKYDNASQGIKKLGEGVDKLYDKAFEIKKLEKEAELSRANASGKK